MNDLFILNGAQTIIYAACLYDYKNEKIVLFQVSKKYNIICISFIHIYYYNKRKYQI